MRIDRPGYMRRVRKDGTVAHYWSPKRAIKGTPDHLDMRRIPDHFDDAGIVEQCRAWTEELRTSLSERSAKPAFDGTIDGVIDHYRRSPESPLRKVKHSTRTRDYEPSMRVLSQSVGKRRVDKLVASDFRRWFEQWMPKGHRRAYGAMKMLRILLTYGTGEKLHGCSEAREILSTIRFELPESREVMMTFDHAKAIVEAAIAEKLYSVAFTEALKFETALRRIDVIGEWVPNGDGPMRWTGLSAGQISKDLVLTLKTSKTSAPIERDLKVLPLVMLALKHYTLPKIGPVVINEATKKPWREPDYGVAYRTARATAKVPSNIWSMDSRAGAITEAKIATGSLDKARDLATHTDGKMTKRYVRGGDLVESTETAAARVAHRAVKRQ